MKGLDRKKKPRTRWVGNQVRLGARALNRSISFRAGAALAGVTAMLVAVAAEKIELAKPEQVDDAKAQVAATGVPCTVGKVRFVGNGSPLKDDKGKQIQTSTYEVTCGDNKIGYVVQGPKGGSPDHSSAYSCPGLKASTDPKKSGQASCQFPENQDLKGPVQALAQQAGVTCAVSNVKWRGIGKTGTEYYEMACGPGQIGYVVSVSKDGKSVVPQNCLTVQGTSCTLTTAEQQSAWVAALAVKTGKSCQVTKSRFVGVTKSDDLEVYEVGCATGPGFMFGVTHAGEFKRTIECAEAGGLSGGCQLTDKAVLQQATNAGYGGRLKAAGIACNVQQARLIGATRKKQDVVEFQCSDRPAGLVVALPTGAGDQADVVDCLDAHHFGTDCEYTPRDAQLALLTKVLTAGGKTCTVSDFKNLGSVDGKSYVFEVACGASPGWIVEIPLDYSSVKHADTCAEAAKTEKTTGLSCTIAGNH
jgi:hypothetical protein